MHASVRGCVLSYSNRRTAVTALGQGAFMYNILSVYAFAVRTVHTFSAWFVDGAAAAVFALEKHVVISLCSWMGIAKAVATGTNSRGTNLDNINTNEARTAGAKVAPFVFILSKFWGLEMGFAIVYLLA